MKSEAIVWVGGGLLLLYMLGKNKAAAAGLTAGMGTGGSPYGGLNYTPYGAPAGGSPYSGGILGGAGNIAQYLIPQGGFQPSSYTAAPTAGSNFLPANYTQAAWTPANYTSNPTGGLFA